MTNRIAIDSAPVEEVCLGIASVYKNVSLAQDPIYRWLQVVNDVTILGEDVRRGAARQTAATERAIKVLMRLLDFLGYYLYAASFSPADKSFAAFVSTYLKKKSYDSYFPTSEPKEGLTRWVLVKYPRVCSKCGYAPCHCIFGPGSSRIADRHLIPTNPIGTESRKSGGLLDRNGRRRSSPISRFQGYYVSSGLCTAVPTTTKTSGKQSCI